MVRGDWVGHIYIFRNAGGVSCKLLDGSHKLEWASMNCLEPEWFKHRV